MIPEYICDDAPRRVLMMSTQWLQVFLVKDQCLWSLRYGDQAIRRRLKKFTSMCDLYHLYGNQTLINWKSSVSVKVSIELHIRHGYPSSIRVFHFNNKYWDRFLNCSNIYLPLLPVIVGTFLGRLRISNIIGLCTHGIRKCVPSPTTSGFTPRNRSNITALWPPSTTTKENKHVQLQWLYL